MNKILEHSWCHSSHWIYVQKKTELNGKVTHKQNRKTGSEEPELEIMNLISIETSQHGNYPM